MPEFPEALAIPELPQASFTSFVASPQDGARAVAFRFFHGAIPPTLSVREQLAIAVAERIITRKLEPGLRIREAQLAEEFGVSKSPVSEALGLLEHYGLIETFAHRGAYVSRMSVADCDELLEFRFALARSFLPRYVSVQDRADHEVLQRYLARLTELLSLDDSAFEFSELTDRCLLFLAIRAGNARMTRAMSAISLQYLRYFAMATRTVRERRLALAQWTELAALLAARNTQRVLAHIEEAYQSRGAAIRASIQAVA